ncbi:MAG: DUF2079 domain-containing protein [Caldilinea sp.]|nr:DUF2079 domain-containing protein [Caldilinea sp.]MDW8441012.1 DUF2079 domain-containing protein [Caldilineaceae bacterium]
MNPSDPRSTRFLVHQLPLALLALAVLLYALYFSHLTLLRYHAFESRALDMGNLNQTIWNTAHGDWFRITNQEVDLTNRLGYHVEPILLPIALLYRLHPFPETLLVLQATVVALGALPLYALARLRGLNGWPALSFALAFLLNPTIQAANWLEFHPVTLAPTFLMAAFYFLIAGHTRRFALFALLAAACKEEIGLLVAMIGLYAWLALRRPGLGLTTMALAGGWSLLAVFGVQQAAAGGNIHWGRYAYLGETTLEKLATLATRPDVIAAQLQRADIGRYFFELLLPLGFMPLLAPEVLLLALPSLAINLLADFNPMHRVTTLIYAAPVAPFVILAAVMGVARVNKRMCQTPVKVNKMPFGQTPSATQRRLDADERKALVFQAAAAFFVLGGAVMGQRLWGYLPGGGNHLPLTVTEHHRRAETILAQIPPDAAVSAQDRLNPHVSGRRTLYIFPRVDDADYVLLDVTGPAWPQHPSDLKRSVDALLAGEFGIAAAGDGYLLLQRGAPLKTPPPEFYTAWQPTSHPPDDVAMQEVAVVFGDDADDLLALRSYGVGVDRYGELVTTLVWEALRPLDEDYRFYIAYFDSELQAIYDTRFYPPTAVLWYPTSLWTPGAPVLVQTLPWTLDADRFALGVGVYASDEGWDVGMRLKVRTVEPTLPLLQEGTLVRLGGFARNGEQRRWITVAPDAGVPTRVVDAAFTGGLHLEGSRLPEIVRRGEPTPVTLFWRADASPQADYSIFVQALDAEGRKVAQWDGAPADGVSLLPASAWPKGWRGAQTVLLPPPAVTMEGEYTVIVGMYDWQSGERLPVGDGDFIEIGRVRIKP